MEEPGSGGGCQHCRKVLWFQSFFVRPFSSTASIFPNFFFLSKEGSGGPEVKFMDLALLLKSVSA
jgi:hypothetical protein